jgi:regulator of replication initiation timing
MMMEQGIQEFRANAPLAGQLEPYQRLVELQKQMIELAQQNERTKQECAKLRERLATEMTSPTKPRQGLRHRANRALKKLPGATAVKSNLVSLILKEASTC